MYKDALVTEDDITNLPKDIKSRRMFLEVSDFLRSEPNLALVVSDYVDELKCNLDEAGMTGKPRKKMEELLNRTVAIHIFLIQRAMRRLLADFVPEVVEISEGTTANASHDKDGAQ